MTTLSILRAFCMIISFLMIIFCSHFTLISSALQYSQPTAPFTHKSVIGDDFLIFPTSFSLSSQALLIHIQFPTFNLMPFVNQKPQCTIFTIIEGFSRDDPRNGQLYDPDIPVSSIVPFQVSGSTPKLFPTIPWDIFSYEFDAVRTAHWATLKTDGVYQSSLELPMYLSYRSNRLHEHLFTILPLSRNISHVLGDANNLILQVNCTLPLANPVIPANINITSQPIQVPIIPEFVGSLSFLGKPLCLSKRSTFWSCNQVLSVHFTLSDFSPSFLATMKQLSSPQFAIQLIPLGSTELIWPQSIGGPLQGHHQQQQQHQPQVTNDDDLISVSCYLNHNISSIYRGPDWHSLYIDMPWEILQGTMNSLTVDCQQNLAFSAQHDNFSFTLSASDIMSTTLTPHYISSFSFSLPTDPNCDPESTAFSNVVLIGAVILYIGVILIVLWCIAKILAYTSCCQGIIRRYVPFVQVPDPVLGQTLDQGHRSEYVYVN